MPGGVTASANPPTQGSKYRIKVGQTIGGLVWSNVAYTVDGKWQILYDDGTPDIWPVVQSASGSSRAAVLWTTEQIAKKNGWVIGGVVFGAAASQRGQSYIQAFVVDANYAPASITDYLAMGYAYASKPVEFGTFVEPGPAGGNGATTRAFKNATAVNGVTGLVLAVVPSGAIWKMIAGIALYTATATAGTRTVDFRFRDASANRYLQSNRLSPTAGLTGSAEFGKNFTTEGTVGIAGLANSIEGPSPDGLLLAGYDLFVLDGAAIDVADTCSWESQVEEWVMPN